jgi:hypothetical protein
MQHTFSRTALAMLALVVLVVGMAAEFLMLLLPKRLRTRRPQRYSQP